LDLQEKRNGAVVGDSVRNGDDGVEVVFFENKFKEISGETMKNLEFMKFGKESPTTMCWAKCCGTLMCQAHTAYQGQTIYVPRTGPKISEVEYPEFAGACYTSYIPDGKDVPAEYADLPSFRGDEADLLAVPFVQWYLGTVGRPAPEHSECATDFQQLQEACGEVVVLPKIEN
jgi:hypothetical protein